MGERPAPGPQPEGATPPLNRTEPPTNSAGRRCPGWLAGLLLAAAACAPVPQPRPAPPVAPPAVSIGDLAEIPEPDGPWREHRLARCPADVVAPPAVETELGLCSELFRSNSGSDGMIELELTMVETARHPWVLLTLGQLYLMAGQGVPELLPSEGPAAETGDWPRDQVRLLGRARALLEEAGRSLPDEAAVDYLLADVARAGGDLEGAAELVARGLDKCTGGRAFRIMQMYQDLNLYPAELLATPPPAYPQEAIAAGISGKVRLDLLLDPAGQVRQVVVVATPAPELAAAAAEAFRASSFAPARVGKYPVWAWLQVATNFRLSGG